MSAMHFLLVALFAQGLSPKPVVQHVSAAPSIARGADGQVILALDVTPNPGIHVYARGARDFSPVSLQLTPSQGVTPGKPAYPKPDPAVLGSVDDAPAYYKTFRITQPVSLAPGREMVIGGVLKYQSCDDRLCYPVASLPVTWTITENH